jgi:quinoprotein glucose dehydrogenase
MRKLLVGGFIAFTSLGAQAPQGGANNNASLLGQNGLPRPMDKRPRTDLVRGNVPGEWRVWGADAWSTRYSPLDQINASNFDSLQVAWQWNAGTLGWDEYNRTTPLYANGRLFTVATNRRDVAAIDPTDGSTLWTYRLNEGIRWQKAPRRFAGRGLTYWTDGNIERVIVVTPGYHMVSLDAHTGRPDPMFGKGGIVDLMEGLGFPLVPLAVDDTAELLISDERPMRAARPGEGWDPVKKIGADGTVGIDPKYGQIAHSSPAIMVGNVIVLGNSSIHGYYPVRVRNIPGFIRGFDVRTGRQLWKFNLVPQPGEFGAETWEKGSKIGDEGVGKNDAWATYSADPDLGLVYIPVGMPLMDEYGGHRPGANLFGNSLVAIDAKTGRRKWHFQTVHHDIWDYDLPMAPNLMDVTINGQRRKIIAQTSKQGWIYTFDRVTGEPIWPIVETPVLQSDVPGEKTWPTQPIPTKPEPYSQQGFVEADVIDYTPAIRDSALKLARTCRMGLYYIPPTHAKAETGPKCAWYSPGASGGVNIDGGAAVDVETGMMYVGSQTGMSTIQVQKDPCSEFNFSSIHDSCGSPGALPPPPGYVKPTEQIGGFARRGGNFTRFTYGPGQANILIVKPKEHGGVTAYDMNSGDKKFWIPNGTMIQPPKVDTGLFAGVNVPPVGGPGQAQIIATKSLVIYGNGRNVAATLRNPVGSSPPVSQSAARLWAIDKATGKTVGSVRIPQTTTAVPMTFMHEGKQYIVFAIGQGRSNALVALTLPESLIK